MENRDRVADFSNWSTRLAILSSPSVHTAKILRARIIAFALIEPELVPKGQFRLSTLFPKLPSLLQKVLDLISSVQNGRR